MKNNILTGVSLGPGDPELITLKGLRALQSAEVIFYPASLNSEGTIRSFSLAILKGYELSATMVPLHIPMKADDLPGYYSKAFATILPYLRQGRSCVVVTEGDISFFSTFSYLAQEATKHEVMCRVIPGVPAFIATGALTEQPLVLGDESLTVLARPQHLDEVAEQLAHHHTVVVMKPSVLKGQWVEFLKHHGNNFFYVERVGTPQQYATHDILELAQREIPYFSLLIIYCHGKNAV